MIPCFLSWSPQSANSSPRARNVAKVLRHGAVLNALTIQGDFLVRSVLAQARLEVRRFASVQALRCCVGPCFSHSCYKRVLPTRDENRASRIFKAMRPLFLFSTPRVSV